MNPNTRQQLEDALAQRILIIDGAMGTMLQSIIRKIGRAHV